MSLKDKYLFGLWKSSLLTDLMWTSAPGQVHMPERVPVYRAPSWSWASMDGEIAPFPWRHEFAEIGRVFRSGVLSAKTDKFGSTAESAYIRISGGLKSVRLCLNGSGSMELGFFFGARYTHAQALRWLYCR